MIKLIITDDNGKVELTKKELEKMLQDAYKEGLKARINNATIITTSQDKIYLDQISQAIDDWHSRYDELDSDFTFDFGWVV